MKRIFLASFLLISIVFFFGCKPQIDTSEIDNHKLREVLKVAQAEIADLKSADDLVHIVYFKMKEDALKEGLITEIKKLENIEVLHNLEVGVFENLGDPRAMSDYDIIMQMEFENKADYKIYQAHPLHLGLKKAAGAYLAGPPVTYDYWEK